MKNVCRPCMQLFKTEQVCRAHINQQHKGITPAEGMASVADFDRGTEFKVRAPGTRGFKTTVPMPVGGGLTAPPETGRVIPPKTEWNQATALVGLPWVKYPTTPQCADEIAFKLETLLGVARMSDESRAVLHSQAEFYRAYAQRLKQQGAA